MNSVGVTAAVLKYRVPQREGTLLQVAPPMALADAQRAIALVRSRSAEWGVDRSKVGVIGFSAGGHLAAWVSTFGEAERCYEPQDDADAERGTPDFAVLLYPYGIINFDSQRFDPNLKVTKATPPTFLVVASDDDFCVQNATAYYRKLVRKKVPAELHAFETGGHSFALRRTGTPSADWPRRCEEWMRGRGLCTPGK